MQYHQPSSWSQRIVGAIALLIGLAVAGRIIYELLAPLLPGLLALLLLAAVVWVIVRGRG